MSVHILHRGHDRPNEKPISGTQYTDKVIRVCSMCKCFVDADGRRMEGRQVVRITAKKLRWWACQPCAWAVGMTQEDWQVFFPGG